MEPTVRCRFGEWERLDAQERVIQCVQEQGWDGDSVEELARARLRPIVDGILKAMKLRGVTVVELFEAPDCSSVPGVQLVRETDRFRLNFGDQGLEETPQVNAVTRSVIQSPRAGSEINGGRDRHRRDDRFRN